MSNTPSKVVLMGLLLAHLASCGSRKGDGSPNASGKLYLYKAGTIQQEQGYTDADCTVPISTTAGAIPLDQAGKAKIYVKAPVDQVIADSTGTAIDQQLAANYHRAELVEVVNPGFTGGITDPATGLVTQGLGGKTTLQTILTNLYGSIGPDGQYLAGAGGTQRNVSDWLRGFAIFATDFGAFCDGLHDDTVAIQKAINFVAGKGGGVVMLPPGTTLVASGGSGLAITTSGVTLQGRGQGISVIKNMSTTVDTLTISGAIANTVVRGIGFTTNAASTGKSINASGATGMILDDVSTTGSAVGLAMASLNTVTITGNCNLAGSTSAATFSTVSTLTSLGTIFTGGVVTTTCTNAFFYGGSGAFTLDAGSTGVAVVGGSATFSFTTTLPAAFFQRGTGSDGQSINVAIGGTATAIDLGLGQEVLINANSGGAGTVTVPDPAAVPASTQRNFILIVKYRNATGGAVTWSFSGTKFVHVGGAVPAGTDGHTIEVQYLWDGTKFREICRGDTVT